MGEWGQDAGGGWMATEGLPAWTALGWMFCPEECSFHTQGPCYKGIWRSWLGEARSFTSDDCIHWGLLMPRKPADPRKRQQCCVTSGKFHPISGPWFSHLNTEAVRTSGFSGVFLLQHSISQGHHSIPVSMERGAGASCYRDRYGSSCPPCLGTPAHSIRLPGAPG